MACINIVNYEVPIVRGLTTRPFTNHRLRHRRDRESNVALLGPVVNAKFTVTRIGLWIMIKYSSSYLDFSGCDGDDKHANQRPLRGKVDEATEAAEAVPRLRFSATVLVSLSPQKHFTHGTLDWSLHSRTH